MKKVKNITFIILINIFISFFLLEGILQIVSAVLDRRQPQINIQNAENQIWILGESTTAWGGDYSYPFYLQVKLDNEFGQGKYSVVNLSRSGSNSKEQLEIFKEALLTKKKPIMVTAMLGINDWWALPLGRYDGLHEKLWNLRTYRFFYLLYENYIKFYFKSFDPLKLLPLPSKYFPQLNMSPDQLALLDQLISKRDVTGAERFLKKEAPPEELHKYLYYAVHLMQSKFGTPGDRINLNSQNHFLELCEKAQPEFLPCLEKLILIKAFRSPDFEVVERLAKKIEQLNSNDPQVYVAIALLYKETRHRKEAIHIIENYLKRYPVDHYFLWKEFFSILIEENDQGRMAHWSDIYERAYSTTMELSILSDLPVQREFFYKHIGFLKNIKELTQICLESEIQFVSVQYPMLSNQELKRALDHSANIIWVENRTNFETALKSVEYNQLFTDKFSHSFGHFTGPGAELVADEIFKNIKGRLK